VQGVHADPAAALLCCRSTLNPNQGLLWVWEWQDPDERVYQPELGTEMPPACKPKLPPRVLLCCRYDIAGALRFLLLRQYKATIWYKPAPQHQADSADSVTAAAAAAPKKQQQQQHSVATDAVVSPAAVSPLSHHRAPALHARLSMPGSRPPWQQQPRRSGEGLLPDDPGCCHSSHLLSSNCSSESSSRRSSMDGSGPVVKAAEVIGDAVGTAAPVPAAAAAVVTEGSGHSREDAAVVVAVGSERAPAGAVNKQQQQQQGKTVSFLPHLAAAIHASAASFSSRGSIGSGGGVGSVGGAASQLPSRASSITSQSSTSRCHSRCSRCSAAAFHRSSSRQTFAMLAGVSPEAPAQPAASILPTVLSSSPSSRRDPALGSIPQAAPADVADGVVEVTPMPAAAGPGCAAGPSVAAAAADVAAASAAAAGDSGAPPGPGWVKVQGEFASVMCVVTSCISEKSRQGLMPEAHLADGRLALVMVERCSRLQYLRFLIQLASKGIVPGSLPFVKVLYATEVQVGRSEDPRASLSSCPACRSLQPHKLDVGLRVSQVSAWAARLAVFIILAASPASLVSVSAVVVSGPSC